ncbi:hypothetical protein GEO20_15040 [Rhodococcus erythropolis]|nr:hypothetical protein [Rhodococcus erythropolis]
MHCLIAWSRVVFSGLASRSATKGRTRPDIGRDDMLSPGCFDAADGETRRVVEHHQLVEVSGVDDGLRPRRASRIVPDPTLDQGPYAFEVADAPVLKVRENGRVMNVDALIAVGINKDGHREILRHRRLLRRGQSRLDNVLPRTGRPRTDRGETGAFRRPRRPRGVDRSDAARWVVAPLSNALLGEPDVDHTESAVA